MAFGKLENVIGNIGFVGNWNEKHHGVGYIGKLNWK